MPNTQFSLSFVATEPTEPVVTKHSMAQSKLDAETTMKRKRAGSESDGGDDDTTAHWDFQRRFQDFKKMTFRSQTSEAMEQLPALMRLSCADSDSRTTTSFRSILKHGGFKNRNYVVIYQRLLYFWWQQNGDDRLQVDTICEENVQFTAVLDVLLMCVKSCQRAAVLTKQRKPSPRSLSA